MVFTFNGWFMLACEKAGQLQQQQADLQRNVSETNINFHIAVFVSQSITPCDHNEYECIAY